MGVAIKCNRKDCKFNNGGWCDLDHIEINEKGECTEYGLDEHKKIVEYNTSMVKLIEELGKMETLSEKDKDYFATLLVLAMKTEDGETVADKLFADLKERDSRG